MTLTRQDALALLADLARPSTMTTRTTPAECCQRHKAAVTREWAGDKLARE